MIDLNIRTVNTPFIRIDYSGTSKERIFKKYSMIIILTFPFTIVHVDGFRDPVNFMMT